MTIAFFRYIHCRPVKKMEDQILRCRYPRLSLSSESKGKQTVVGERVKTRCDPWNRRHDYGVDQPFLMINFLFGPQWNYCFNYCLGFLRSERTKTFLYTDSKGLNLRQD